MPNFDDASRLKYAREIPSNDDISTGCLQRIASTTELMAKSYQNPISDRDSYKQSKEMWQRLYEGKSRQVSALRGVITKLKKQIQ